MKRALYSVSLCVGISSCTYFVAPLDPVQPYVANGSMDSGMGSVDSGSMSAKPDAGMPDAAVFFVDGGGTSDNGPPIVLLDGGSMFPDSDIPPPPPDSDIPPFPCDSSFPLADPGGGGPRACISPSLVLQPDNVGLDSDPSSIVLADLNEDNRLDAIVPSRLSDQLGVMLGNGDGTFQGRVTYEPGNNPRYVAVGKLNADQHLDVVVISSGVNVLLGNGDGTLQAAIEYSTSAGLTGVALADMNNDTMLDVLSLDYTNAKVGVLLGNGNGTLQSRVDFAVAAGPGSVAVGKLDADCNTDVVTYGEYGGSAAVSVLLGNGDGTLQANTDYREGTGPYDLALGDLNGDTALDILTTNFNGLGLTVNLGNGDGTFQPSVDVLTSVEQHAIGIGLADFDADGKLDVAVGGPLDEAVLVLRGDGVGAFTSIAPMSTGSGSRPTHLAVGDLNGDLRPDAVYLDMATEQMKVLLNNCMP